MSYHVGIIGIGIMGQRMLVSMSRHPQFDVTHIWDINEAACQKIQNSHPEIHIAATAESLVAEHDLDLIYIATPPSTHIHYAQLAIHAGKHIFCEKPLAVDVAASRKLVQEVQAAGRYHAVNFPFAAEPGINTLQNHIEDGRHGQARLIDMRFHFSSWPRAWQQGAAGWLSGRAEGGFVREVFSHFAYLTHKLVGPLVIRDSQVTFPADGETAETYITASLDCAGIPVYVSGGVGGAAPDYNEWTLYGSQRSYRLYDWQPIKVATTDRWYDLMPDREPKRFLGDQLDELAKMLAGEPHMLPDFSAGLAVQEVVEGLLKSV